MVRKLILAVGFAFLTLIGVFYLAFGGLYASVGDFLFFHRAALPQGTETPFLQLYLGLMKLIGGASIALGGLGLYVLFTAVRVRRLLALPVLVVSWSIPLFVAAYVAETLRQNTGAPTSANLMAILFAVLVVGAVCWAAGGRSPSRS